MRTMTARVQALYRGNQVLLCESFERHAQGRRVDFEQALAQTARGRFRQGWASNHRECAQLDIDLEAIECLLGLLLPQAACGDR